MKKQARKEAGLKAARAERSAKRAKEIAALPARIKTFFLTPTGEMAYAKRYHCKCGESWTVDQGQFPTTEPRPEFSGQAQPCPACSAEVDPSSQAGNRIYRRADTGEEVGADGNLPVGGLWESNPEYDYPRGADGRSIWCALPDGHSWLIDGMANNCTKPDDKEHRCWVRTGSPEEGTCHVDKNGKTCDAGAGSIKTTHYHGFLRHGWLERC